MAVRKAAGLLGGGNSLPETFGYSVKRRLLGPPLVNEQLGEERLSVPLALGVLSPGRHLLLGVRQRGNPHRAAP